MSDDRRLATAVGLDTFVVVLFVAIGRRTHDESGALSAVLETAVPFLCGLAIGWWGARAWRWPTKVLTGVAIWPTTVLAGMIIRRLVFDDGTATSFVVVTTAFLGTFLVGWRAVWRLVERRRRAATLVAVSRRVP